VNKLGYPRRAILRYPLNRKEEKIMETKNEATMAKFSVLKEVHPKVEPMQLHSMKCQGQCTCRCCK
ncbi:hypothetical protein KAT95_02620, partial [Candidatus Parcubacteria bacterium]|nr:hypothetical protein [Candidatus Parcubacteria bacterium]